LPTLLELLGQTKPSHCQDKSRVPLLKGEIMPPQKRLYGMVAEPG